MKHTVELRSSRDFGQIINDSFTFLKENFKPLFRAMLIVCSIFILISTVSTVYTYTNMASIYNGNFGTETNVYGGSSPSMNYLLGVLFTAFVTVFLQAAILLITLCYISVYLEKNKLTPTFEEIWGYFKYYMWRVMGGGILIALMTVVAFILCVLPFFWVLPIFYLIIPIMVIENTSFSYAFNKSFKLIKDNWWMVFGVIFVMSLIVGVASSIANVPLTLIPLASKFMMAKKFPMLPLIIIFSFLKSLFILLYVLPAIAIAMCYFSLSETKEGLGLMGRIEKFGSATGANPDLPAEEF